MWDSSVPKKKGKGKRKRKRKIKGYGRRHVMYGQEGVRKGYIMRCIAQRNQVGSMHELLYINSKAERERGRSLGIFQRISQLLRSTLSQLWPFDSIFFLSFLSSFLISKLPMNYMPLALSQIIAT